MSIFNIMAGMMIVTTGLFMWDFIVPPNPQKALLAGVLLACALCFRILAVLERK